MPLVTGPLMKQAKLQTAHVPQTPCPPPPLQVTTAICHAAPSPCIQQKPHCCLCCSTHHSATKVVSDIAATRETRPASVPPNPYMTLKRSSTACLTSCTCLKVTEVDHPRVRLDQQAPWRLNAAAINSRSCWGHEVWSRAANRNS